MYRVTLTADQRQELQRRTRLKGLAPATRDRLEMVRLSDAGWSVPKIAHHLGLHHQTVRAWIKAFLTAGFDALPNKPRGGKTSRLTPAMLESIRAELAKAERTWSSPQLADWLAEHHGHRISPGRLRVHLKRVNLSSQRTSCSLKHKQDPEQLAERKAALEALAKKGRLD
jgi:transposase